jgi:hypothetical protein
MVGQEQFRSYLDESANSPNELYGVGGFIGKTDVWVGLEPLWLESLPPGITTFHATDCFSGNNDFEGVSIARRPELLNKVTDLIARHEIRLIGYGIDAKTYRQIAPKRKNNDFLGNIYAAPLGGAIQLSCEAMGNGPTPDLIWSVLENGEHWEKCGFFMKAMNTAPVRRGQLQTRAAILTCGFAVGLAQTPTAQRQGRIEFLYFRWAILEQSWLPGTLASLSQPAAEG